MRIEFYRHKFWRASCFFFCSIFNFTYFQWKCPTFDTFQFPHNMTEIAFFLFSLHILHHWPKYSVDFVRKFFILLIWCAPLDYFHLVWYFKQCPWTVEMSFCCSLDFEAIFQCIRLLSDVNCFAKYCLVFSSVSTLSHIC